MFLAGIEPRISANSQGCFRKDRLLAIHSGSGQIRWSNLRVVAQTPTLLAEARVFCGIIEEHENPRPGQVLRHRRRDRVASRPEAFPGIVVKAENTSTSQLLGR